MADTLKRVQAALRGSLLIEELTEKERSLIADEIDGLYEQGLAPMALGAQFQGNTRLLDLPSRVFDYKMSFEHPKESNLSIRKYQMKNTGNNIANGYGKPATSAQTGFQYETLSTNDDLSHGYRKNYSQNRFNDSSNQPGEDFLPNHGMQSPMADRRIETWADLLPAEKSELSNFQEDSEWKTTNEQKNELKYQSNNREYHGKVPHRANFPSTSSFDRSRDIVSESSSGGIPVRKIGVFNSKVWKMEQAKKTNFSRDTSSIELGSSVNLGSSSLILDDNIPLVEPPPPPPLTSTDISSHPNSFQPNPSTRIVIDEYRPPINRCRRCLSRNHPEERCARSFRCHVCGKKNSHFTENCRKADRMTINRVLNGEKICFNCLKFGHRQIDCPDELRFGQPRVKKPDPELQQDEVGNWQNYSNNDNLDEWGSIEINNSSLISKPQVNIVQGSEDDEFHVARPRSHLRRRSSFTDDDITTNSSDSLIFEQDPSRQRQEGDYSTDYSGMESTETEEDQVEVIQEQLPEVMAWSWDPAAGDDILYEDDEDDIQSKNEEIQTVDEKKDNLAYLNLENLQLTNIPPPPPPLAEANLEIEEKIRNIYDIFPEPSKEENLQESWYKNDGLEEDYQRNAWMEIKASYFCENNESHEGHDSTRPHVETDLNLGVEINSDKLLENGESNSELLKEESNSETSLPNSDWPRDERLNVNKHPVPKPQNYSTENTENTTSIEKESEYIPPPLNEIGRRKDDLSTDIDENQSENDEPEVLTWSFDPNAPIINIPLSPTIEKKELKRKPEPKQNDIPKNFQFGGSNDEDPPRLIVEPIPLDISSDRIYRIFSRFGEIDYCGVIPGLSDSNENLEQKQIVESHGNDGTAYVDYINPADAYKAMNELQNAVVFGRNVKIRLD